MCWGWFSGMFSTICQLVSQPSRLTTRPFHVPAGGSSFPVRNSLSASQTAANKECWTPFLRHFFPGPGSIQGSYCISLLCPFSPSEHFHCSKCFVNGIPKPETPALFISLKSTAHPEDTEDSARSGRPHHWGGQTLRSDLL